MPDLTIGPATIIAFRYDLYDAEAERIESTGDGAPIVFLFGERTVLAALQDAFRGKCAGDDFSVTIPHERAYGRRYPDRLQRLSRKQLEGGDSGKAKARKLRAGEIVTLRGEHGPTPATIVKVGKFQIDVDANHPLAGRDLTFDVKIDSVREATPEEQAHGHAHGPGGHHH